MSRPIGRILALWLLASASLLAQDPARRLELSFTVDVTRPESGRIKVAMAVEGNEADEVRASIPAWAPGAYRIVKYAKQVRNVTAADPDGKKLAVTPVDDQTWAVKAAKAPRFTVSYELVVDRNRMDKTHCFLAGPDTYFYLVGRKDTPCRARFLLPDGWKVGTGLTPDGDGYSARDYDTFIDCPTELGRFELLQFEADGAAYQLVIHAKGPVDGPRLTDMIRKIVVEQNRMFGGPPFDRYVFVYHFQDGTGGRGLEHLNSTDIVMPYSAVRVDPRLIASITSHEYFHLWNVKRIRPAELGPFDYTQIVRSKALWLCEGVTSYFGDRTLARSGLWSEQQYLDHLAGEIETLQNNPDRKVTSMEKASQSVWDRKDYPRVDYYNKGELLGLLLDLKIRTASGGEKSFDDVMRLLYDRYVVQPSKEGKGPIGVGFPEEAILQAINEIAGTDETEFYERYIRGVEELPYKEILAPAGLSLLISSVRLPDLGAEIRGTVVSHVFPRSQAEQAGLEAGDRILAVDGDPVTRSTLREAVGRLTPGDEAVLKITRAMEEVEITVKVGLRERTACRLRRADKLDPDQKKILDGWLGRSRDY